MKKLLHLKGRINEENELNPVKFYLNVIEAVTLSSNTSLLKCCVICLKFTSIFLIFLPSEPT